MKIPKCPACGSKEVILTTDIESVNFYITEFGAIDFDTDEIEDLLTDCLHWSSVMCECQDCFETWDYEDD